MREKYPDVEWVAGDCTDLEFRAATFDAVLDKGTLDALCCDAAAAKTTGRRYVAECFRVLRPGGVLFVASFGSPEMRRSHLEASAWESISVETLEIAERRNDRVYVYILKKPRRRRFLAALGALAAAAAAMIVGYRRAAAAAVAAPGRDLAPTPGAPQCNYELLKSFSHVAGDVRWTLGAGTLLGALRTEPPGLLPWEHDVDVYAPARDAAALATRLADRCAAGTARDASCGFLEFRGFVDAGDSPCCGFGFKAFHNASDACELDVLVLAASPYAPWTHGQRGNPWTYPPLPRLVAAATRRRGEAAYLVIPEDVDRGLLLGDDSRWAKDSSGDWRFLGPEISYFQDEYFSLAEFEPFGSVRMYDVDLPVPRDPWASLNRTYGPTCSYTARIDEHGGVYVDLRLPEHAHLKRPAEVAVREVV